MNTETISMCGAAWLRSHIASFPSRDAFVKSEIKGSAFCDKEESTRIGMLRQVYDLAVPKKKK